MARGEEGGGGLYGFLTFIAVAMLVAVVVLSIRTYDSDDEEERMPVATAGQTGGAGQTAGQPGPESPQIATEPVGGVATGGGGTAVDDSGSLVLPVLGGLVVLTLLAAARVLWWPRRGLTPA